ncbi:magnesium transporter [Gordonia pseudamarae]|jgi:magnesium transporter|uniref:Magnesium transporter n=1 Tax=Gordonia pseudamarae TaxID=2831662 RepID=A0ABX6IL52_9ACTN|nr:MULTISPECIES: magnesium transporter CorA family protein [Gordonia]MBD0020718.1 magnesium transporter CorA family protein [Gordonia sp. (in: high G+C Gram-positive bacteria)]QHN27756.1 magnesium transporter [Gordonia pseudamarae]QHN36638.1 magnesium transporter [Gordonia pseudamarae]
MPPSDRSRPDRIQPAPERIRGQIWRNGAAVDGFSLDTIEHCLDDPELLVWADLESPSHATLSRLAHELKLSPFAVEDTLAAAERVKTVAYATHTFLMVYAVSPRSAASGDDRVAANTPGPPTISRRAESFELHRISIFLKGNTLITVRGGPGFDVDELMRRWADTGGEQYGVGALLHGLLDLVVDGHFDAVQVLDDQIEELEEILFADDGRGRDLQRRSYSIRRDLVILRRVVLPMREVLATVQRRRIDNHAPPELDPHFSDLYDHALRAAEWTESLRDMIATVFETNLSLADARLNTVMKKLTSWAAIVAVPTAITGFYGQNVPFPGFSSTIGFIVSSTLIVVAVAVLYVSFRRRDWL